MVVRELSRRLLKKLPGGHFWQIVSFMSNLILLINLTNFWHYYIFYNFLKLDILHNFVVIIERILWILKPQFMTIKTDTGRHSQFLRCFLIPSLSFGNKSIMWHWRISSESIRKSEKLPTKSKNRQTLFQPRDNITT